MLLTVRTKGGSFVRDLRVQQVRLKQIPGVVKHLEFDNGPKRILFLLDQSGSMRDFTRWQRSMQLIRVFLSRAGNGDKLGLYTFAEECRLEIPLTEDLTKFSALLESSLKDGRSIGPVSGRTLLAKALDEIISDNSGQFQPGDAIVLASDHSTVNDSGKALNHSVRLLGSEGVRVFLLCAEPSGPFAGAENTAVDSLVESNLAHDTGGEVFFIPYRQGKPAFAPDLLNSGTTALYSLIRNCYRLHLELSGPVEEPGLDRIEILDNRGSKSKRVIPIHPRFFLIRQPAPE
jgi:hypothetical protein